MTGAKEKFLALRELRRKQVSERATFADQLRLEVMVLVENFLKSVPIPENGKDYLLTEDDMAAIAGKINVPVVEKVIVEKTEVIREKPIVTEITKVTNETREVAVKDTPLEMAGKLNTLEEQVDKSVIKGLVEELEELRRELKRGSKKNPRLGGGGGSSTTVPTLISGVVDGSNQVFVFSAAPTFLVVDGGRTMQIISSDGTVNWTVAGATVTLTIAPTFDILCLQ